MQGTLFRYLARAYTTYFGFGLCVITCALLLSNMFDTLSKFRGTTLTAALFLQLISLKLPYLLLEILPLICFISTLFFLHYLMKSGELISILNSGASIWTVLLPIVSSTTCIGIMSITMLNPISSMLLSSYDKIASKLENKSHNATLSSFGIMVAENYDGEERIFIVRGIDVETKKLSDLVILFTDQNNNFISRIDANSAILDHGILTLHSGRILRKGSIETEEISRTILTNLSMSHFTQSSLAPEYTSFWRLPQLILALQRAGIAISTYQIYYYKQLFKPLMMIATVLMAACFAQAIQMRQNGTKLLVTGAISGFVVYIFSEICIAILTHQGMAPLFAILCSILGIIILSLFMILHLHEVR